MEMIKMKNPREHAQRLDAADALAKYKSEFFIKEKQYYMDGNSLGLLSRRSEESLLRTLEDWKHFGIDGWTDGENPWFYLAEKLGGLMAPLIGAEPEEVIATGSTTTNLHQLVSTFFQPNTTKNKILADELTFPSDIYALKSQLKQAGLDPDKHLVLAKSRDGRTLDEEDIIAEMDETIALSVLPSVLYRSGQLLDMERLTYSAHQKDIIIGFDLCHSIGAVPHNFKTVNADFAFWCTYKYLNAGPGAVAGLYMNKRHFGKSPGLAGWFGSNKEKQFDMDLSMVVAPNAGGYQIGTPHILSMAPLLGSLEMVLEAGIGNIREKSLALTQYMMDLVNDELSGLGFTIGNPTSDPYRGGHVSLEHTEAARICKALKEKGVIPDFRAPNVIRLAPIALYTTFEDVWFVISILKEIMVNKTYEQYENKRGVIA
jgi:kynureninase